MRQWLHDVKERTGELEEIWREAEDHVGWRKRATHSISMDSIVYGIQDSRPLHVI